MSLTASTLAGAQKRLRYSNIFIALCVVALVAVAFSYTVFPSEEAGFSKFVPFLIVAVNLVTGLFILQTAQTQIIASGEAS